MRGENGLLELTVLKYINRKGSVHLVMAVKSTLLYVSMSHKYFVFINTIVSLNYS